MIHMICNVCNKNIPENSKYCPFCGNIIESKKDYINKKNTSKHGNIGFIIFVVFFVIFVFALKSFFDSNKQVDISSYSPKNESSVNNGTTDVNLYGLDLKKNKTISLSNDEVEKMKKIYNNNILIQTMEDDLKKNADAQGLYNCVYKHKVYAICDDSNSIYKYMFIVECYNEHSLLLAESGGFASVDDNGDFRVSGGFSYNIVEDSTYKIDYKIGFSEKATIEEKNIVNAYYLHKNLENVYLINIDEFK